MTKLEVILNGHADHKAEIILDETIDTIESLK